MPSLALITVLAVLEFFVLGFLVGRARARYKIPAPATSGNEIFDRYFRVHVNTLEQLVVFLPLVWLFGWHVSAAWATGLGVVWIVGRAIYAVSYIRDPKKRAAGFALTAFPSLIMAVGVVIWAVRELLLA